MYERIISFISNVNTRFLLVPCFCWKEGGKVEKGTERNRLWNFTVGTIIFLRNSSTETHMGLFTMGGNRKTCESWTPHQRQWHWGSEMLMEVPSIPCSYKLPEGLPEVNILK